MARRKVKIDWAELTVKKLGKIIRRIKRAFKPPRFLTEDSQVFYQKQIASEWRELIFIDVIIIVFLLASEHQLAYFFEGGQPGFWSWLKAIGFDGAIALFSRNVSRAVVLGESAKATWWALSILMVITVAANVGYEWLIETGGWGDRYVVRDTLKNVRALLISGSLSIIILGISAVRAMVAKSFAERRKRYAQWVKEEEQRATRRIYHARRYSNVKRGRKLI